LQVGDDDSEGRGLKGRALLGFVGLGMLLFVLGFVLAIISLADPDGVSTQEDDAAYYGSSGTEHHSLYLATGLFLSLAGVVMATTAPALFFLMKKRGVA
jgi:hypothetical protein